MPIKKRDFFPLFCAILCVLLFVFGLFTSFFAKSAASVYIAMTAYQVIIFIIPSFFYLKKREIKFSDILPDGFFIIKNVGFTVCSLFLLIFGAILIKMGVFGAGWINFFPMYSSTVKISMSSVYDIILLILVFALLPAITEEFIFRGIAFAEYKNAGVLPSILISSTLFAFIHFDFALFFVYLFAGLIFAAVRYFTESLYTVIAIHFFYNCFALFVEPYIWSFLSRSERIAWFWVILFALFFLFLYLFLNHTQKIIAKKESILYEKKGAENILISFMSPYFISAAALFIIFTVIGLFIG